MGRRTLVTFAGASVEIVQRDEAAAGLVQFVFGRFAPGAPSPARTSLELASDGRLTYCLHRDGALVYRETMAATAARLLLAEAAHHLASGWSEGLLFHAAGVVGERGAILLPGASGCGKSTLAAWLSHAGCGYLSDEMVGVLGKGSALVAFPRPICLEPDASDVLRGVVDAARREGRLLDDERGLLLAPRATAPPASAPLARIVFPRGARGAVSELRPLPKAEAGLRLMGLLVNARQLSDHGFAQIGSLVRHAPAFELVHGTLESAGERLTR